MHTQSLLAGRFELDRLRFAYTNSHIDIGCGDGLAALRLARADPGSLVVGLDICLDNLARQMRRAPANLRFVRADATNPTRELEGMFDSATIAFPFGSLLRGILAEDSMSLGRILSPLRAGASVQVMINESATATTLDRSVSIPSALNTLTSVLHNAQVTRCDHTEIRSWPSTWAKRIGYGKPSVTWLVTGTMPTSPSCLAESMHRPAIAG